MGSSIGLIVLVHFTQLGEDVSSSDLVFDFSSWQDLCSEKNFLIAIQRCMAFPLDY